MPRDWTHNVDLERIDRVRQSLPRGQKTAFIKMEAARIGVSHSTLERAISDAFGKRRQVDREQRVPQDLVDEVARVKGMHEAITLKDQTRELSTEAALDILQAEGNEEAAAWSPSAVNRWLRRSGYRDTKPSTRWQAEYALQLVQMDSSRSKYFQVTEPIPREGQEPDWLCEVSAKELHYKAGAVKLRTWVVCTIDDHSRVRHYRYFASSGESGTMWIQHLRWAFNRPADSHPMRALPETIYSDKGPAHTSKIFKSACRALDIQIADSLPENPQGRGKVERSFSALWQTFESKLATQLVRARGEGCTIRLSKLNQLVHAHAIREMRERRHPIFRDRSQRKVFEQSLLRRSQEVDGWPRILDDDVMDLATRVWTRWADKSRMLSIENVPFEVPRYAAEQWVRCYRTSAGEWFAEMVDGYRKGESFKLKPYDVRALDDWEDRPQRTYATDMNAEAKEQLQEIKRSNIASMTPDGETVSPDAPKQRAEQANAPRPIPMLDARAMVGRALKRQGVANVKPHINRLVAAGVIDEGMTKDEVQAVIDAIGAADTARTGTG